MSDKEEEKHEGSGLLNERPEGMSQEEYKIKRKMQAKIIKNYLRRGSNVSHHPFQYNTKK